MAAPATSRSSKGTSRFYRVDDIELPSVTTILQVIAKPALVQWAAKTERTMVMECAAALYHDLKNTPPMNETAYLTTLDGRIGKQRANQKLLAKAGEIGTQVHAMAEWHFRKTLGQKVGPEPTLEPKAQWAFMALQDWAASVSFRPLLIEQTVYSLNHGYAGTMDLLAEVNGQPMLIDFKTGKAIYAESFLQNVAYQIALIEMGHATPAGGLIVRLPKVETDPEFEVAEVPPAAGLFQVFKSALALWKWWYRVEQESLAKWKAAKDTAKVGDG